MRHRPQTRVRTYLLVVLIVSLGSSCADDDVQTRIPEGGDGIVGVPEREPVTAELELDTSSTPRSMDRREAIRRGIQPVVSSAEDVEHQLSSPRGGLVADFVNDGMVRVSLRSNPATNESEARQATISTSTTHGSSDASTWTIGLDAIGRAQDLRPVDAPRASLLRADGTLWRSRGTWIREWFADDDRGLQQGFVIMRRPSGDSGRLRLALSVAGAEVEAQGRSALLQTPTGMRFAYRDLVAWDARGNALDAAMTSSNHTLLIEVDDRGAQYPVTVDPWIVVSSQKLVGSDADHLGGLGTSIAVSGTTLALGSPGEDPAAPSGGGDVFVFEYNQDGWSEVQRLQANNPDGYDGFGESVALTDRFLVVGAPDWNIGRGAVHVFERDGSRWQHVQEIINPTNGLGGDFGHSVALRASTLVVGAPHEYAEPDEDDRGAVFVFEYDEPRWQLRQQFRPSDSENYDRFGFSVALSSSSMAVGAPGESDSGTIENGAVYILDYDGSEWAQTHKLLAQDKAESDRFGSALSVSGDVLAVGADGEDSGGLPENGAVYIFEHGDSGWIETQKLLANEPSASAVFGTTVAASGHRVAVGAPYQPTEAGVTGATFLFEKADGEWNSIDTIRASDGDDYDGFGSAIALAGTVFAVGAPGNGDALTSRPGAAYVFEAENTPPLASDGVVRVPEGTSTSIPLAGEDRDGDRLELVIERSPGLGTLGSVVDVQHDGSRTTASVEYRHDGSETIADSLTFAVDDGRAVSDPATVEIVIEPVNDIPDASDDTLEAREGQEAQVDVLSNDTDADSVLSYDAVTIVDPPVNGRAFVEADVQRVLYVHDGSETAADRFSYEVCDDATPEPERGCAIATVDITVEPVNDPPRLTTRAPSTATAREPYTHDANATDPENEPLTFTIQQAIDTCGGEMDSDSGVYAFTPANGTYT